MTGTRVADMARSTMHSCRAEDEPAVETGDSAISNGRLCGFKWATPHFETGAIAFEPGGSAFSNGRLCGLNWATLHFETGDPAFETGESAF